MGFGDPDHQHPLTPFGLIGDADCFRCELPIVGNRDYYGCARCNHFVHRLCFGLPRNMTHPHHPQHSLTLSPSSNISSSESCNQCLEPFLGGYAYHCRACLKFNLHLECFLTLNLEEKHHHPLRLWDGYNQVDCRICGLLIGRSDSYRFGCDACDFFIHFDCTFLPPKVKHRHVHQLTFQYNYPENSKIVDCDVCLDTNDGKELDRTLSYYYCESCDYIAHVRCVTSQPPKLTIQFDHFIHEHPMLFFRNPDRGELPCIACHHMGFSDSLYFCAMCNYALHKSCASFPRLIKHPLHKENHTLSLQSYPSQKKNHEQVCCDFCTEELEDRDGWVFRCTDCEFSLHLYCARKFKHPLHEDGVLSFTSCNETKFRCNACGELGDGFRMSDRNPWNKQQLDLHLECFNLPGQIEHGCHSHPLYLVNCPTETDPYLLSIFKCDICDTEADPDLWLYCCQKCKFFAHLKCVVNSLLPDPRRLCDFSSFCSIAMCEDEKYRVRIPKLGHCLQLLRKFFDHPVFIRDDFFSKPEPTIGDQDGRSITSDVTDVLCCPKCEQQISAPAYSSVWDWVHRNLKASIYKVQIETLADHESLALLDEKVVEELHCAICDLLIFPPTYSCAECQIFFHKSCAELPRKYTVEKGHTFVLQSPSMNRISLSNCSLCQRLYKGYAYFCTSCEIGFDVTCAMGAPLMKLENQKHSFSATTSTGTEPLRCNAGQHSPTEGNVYFKCEVTNCSFSLHIECALLPRVVKVKHRIHQHPLVLEPHLDLSVDDYICDVCEKEVNPCVWVYRCSDTCGDRATFHVSCIVTSNKKKCHFVYDEECSYPAR